MTNVVITGGAGFLGSRLARELLAAGSLGAAGQAARPISGLTLIDRAPVAADLAADQRVAAIRGDLGELLDPGRGGPDVLAGADVIFHLAAAVSAECEADFELGMRANLGVTESLLASCRALRTNPVVVFASSVAVFGASEDHPLPGVVDDQTRPNPQSSYGTQKVIGEYLLADYSRRRFLRGRTVRLMTVSVRPGKPNAAASGFLSSIIREPLAGQRATCPVDPGTEVALASPARAVDGLLRAASSSDEAWGGRSAVNLPALTVTVGEMVAGLERVAGAEATALIDWLPDPAVAAIVTGWPGPVPHRSRGPAGPGPRSRLRLRHQAAPRGGNTVRMSSYQHAESIVIARPPEILYDLVCDVTRMGEWSPVCKACWWDDSDGPRPGAWFTGRNELPGRTWETRSQVVLADRGREFAFEVNGGWVRWGYTFAAVDGGTEVTESWEFLPAGLAGFRDRYGADADAQIASRTEAARTGIPRTLTAIKRTAESI